MVFDLPQMQVFVDYVVGDREGTRELSPQMLVLLPNEQRFYLVYRHYFGFEERDEIERCMRLRIVDGASK